MATVFAPASPVSVIVFEAIANVVAAAAKVDELFSAVNEIARVTAKDAWICVESYRNENEKANLLYWQLTCECFFTPEEWKRLFKKFEYTGDYSFIFFE